MPPIPGLSEMGGQSFVSGLVFLVTMIIAAFGALVAFYALAELVIVLVDIAMNVRRLFALRAEQRSRQVPNSVPDAPLPWELRLQLRLPQTLARFA